MISATHVVFGLAIAYVLDKRLVTATVFSVIPDFDALFDFIYPFVHRGVMHSITAVLFFSVLAYVYSRDRESAESTAIGYSSHLAIDLLTFSGVPLFFPFYSNFALGLTGYSSLPANTAIITLSISLMFLKKHWSVLRPIFRRR